MNECFDSGDFAFDIDVAWTHIFGLLTSTSIKLSRVVVDHGEYDDDSNFKKGEILFDVMP